MNRFNCGGSQVSQLNVSRSLALTELLCNNNDLDTLDISQNSALTKLQCNNNQLTSLDISKNAALAELQCQENLLTKLPVSQNNSLTNLDCSGNLLKNLLISQNTALKELICNNNKLTSLNVSQNTALTSLSCGGNSLTSLDVSKNRALTGLFCFDNPLTGLDVSQNTALEYLACSNNQLTSLDLSQNRALENLECFDNQLPLSDLYAISEMEELYFRHFGTQTLDTLETATKMPLSLAGEMKLGEEATRTLFVVMKGENEAVLGTDYTLDYDAETITFLTGGEYTLTLSNEAIISSEDYPAEVVIPVQVTQVAQVDEITLTWTAEVDKEKRIWVRATTGTDNIVVDWGDGTPTQTFSGLGKEYRVLMSHPYGEAKSYEVTIRVVDNNTSLTYLNCTDTQISQLDITLCPALTLLYCANNQLTNLDLTKNIALEDLSCKNNQLTSLDVSQNRALIELRSFDNTQLNSLDVSQNTALTLLYCDNNQLTNLDLTKNIALEDLSCENNQLTELDLSQNRALEQLYGKNNQLTNLDLSHNTVLSYLECQNNQLPLSDLYAISERIEEVDYTVLGTQTLDTLETATKMPLSLAGEMKLGEKATRTHFVVMKGESEAVLGTDYTLDYDAETITFLTGGEYTLTLSNEAIISSEDYPAEVVIPVQVTAGVDMEEVTDGLYVKLYPNPMKEVLYIESSEKVERLTIYDLSGQVVREWIAPEAAINVSDLEKGTYLIRVNGETTKVVKN